MTITTPCAFESTALEVGYNASFNYMIMESLTSNDVIEQKESKVISVRFDNKHEATAELRWPQKTDAASMLPAPDGKNTKIIYAVYDSETILLLYKIGRASCRERVSPRV